MDSDVETDATPAQMDEIKSELERVCPIAAVFLAAGMTITENRSTRSLSDNAH